MAATQILGSKEQLAKYFGLRRDSTDPEEAMKEVTEEMRLEGVGGDEASTNTTVAAGITAGLERRPILPIAAAAVAAQVPSDDGGFQRTTQSAAPPTPPPPHVVGRNRPTPAATTGTATDARGAGTPSSRTAEAHWGKALVKNTTFGLLVSRDKHNGSSQLRRRWETSSGKMP